MALKEIIRLLKPGGQALITVWAKEQEIEKKKSHYISKQADATTYLPSPTSNELIIHKPRTEFQRPDCLVPWSKPSETLLRYYHVFVKNELEHLLSQLTDARILKSYNDDGNWCVIFMKIV